MQRYEAVESAEKIENGFEDAEITFSSGKLVIRLPYANFRSSPLEGGIQVEFDARSVASFVCSDERFESTRNSEKVSEPKPMLRGSLHAYVYPILTVLNSEWLNSCDEVQLMPYGKCQHYRILSLDRIVDVLSCDPPIISILK